MTPNRAFRMMPWCTSMRSIRARVACANSAACMPCRLHEDSHRRQALRGSARTQRFGWVFAPRHGLLTADTENDTMASQTATSSPSRKNGRSQSTARSKSGAARAGSQNALTLLRADHDAVLELFDKFQSASRKDQKQKLADQICTELTIHTMIEEEIFYPSIREAQGEEADALDEALVEHDGAKKLIEEIENGQAGDEMFDAQIKVLSEYIKHHVKEEYREIFPAARKADLDLDELGAQLMARKKELKAQQRHTEDI